MGSSMRKEHSAVDWSQATAAAALARVRRARRRGAARAARGDRRRARSSPARTAGPAEEFQHLIDHVPPPRQDPWRRTSGIHKAKGRRALAAVRELWTDPRRDRPAARHHPGPAGPRLGADRRRQRDADEHGRPARHPGLPRPRGAEVRRPVARRPGAGAHAARHRAAAADDPHRRTAGAARVGRARPGRRGPAGHRPRVPSPRSPRSARSRSRTCSRPTTCAGCSGSRRPSSARTMETAVAEELSRLGARPWQIEITAPILTAAILRPEARSSTELAAAD